MQFPPLALERIRLLQMLQRAALLRGQVVLTPPDLAPAPVNSSGFCQLGQNETKIAVQNKGQLSAGPFSVRLIFADATFDERRVQGLAGGATVTLSYAAAPIMAGQPVWVSVLVDPYNEVAESDETNNDMALACGVGL